MFFTGGHGSDSYTLATADEKTSCGWPTSTALTSAVADRHIPGYPRVDRGNDTLLARYDGAVMNALPWADLQDAGAPAAAAAAALPPPQSAQSQDAAAPEATSNSFLPKAIAQAHGTEQQQRPPWHTQLEVQWLSW